MIASYLRVSIEEKDRKESASIQTQRAEIARYCEQHHITSVQEFVDDGVTGTKPFHQRPGGRDFLERVKQGGVERVIVYRLDRLGRNHIDTYANSAYLIKRGTGVLSVQEGPVEDTSTGRFMLGILTLVSQLERDILLDRTRDGSLTAAKQGRWIGPPPYGYRIAGQGRDAHLVLAEDKIPGCKFTEVYVVRRIFRLAAEGRSCPWIAADLTRLGVPSGNNLASRRPKAGLWAPSRLANMIHNTTYCGRHAWRKRESVLNDDGSHTLKNRKPEEFIWRPVPAIVPEDLWERANTALHANQITQMAHARYPYLLSGLIRCGACNSAFVATTATRPSGLKTSYYRCRKCAAMSVRGDKLENSVWDYVAGFLLRPASAVKEFEQKRAAEGGDSRKVADEIKDLEAALAKRADARKRVLRQYGEGLFTDDEIKQELQRIESENLETEKRLLELRQLKSKAETRTLSIDWAGRLLGGDLRDKLLKGNLTFAEKLGFVRSLVDGITVTPVEGCKDPDIRVKFGFNSDSERYGRAAHASSPLVYSPTRR